MNITNSYSSNNIAFNAKLKILKRNTFSEPSKYFEETLGNLEKDWADKASQIGNSKDSIKITLGKNNINKGCWKKQNLSASAKVNGITVKRNDLNFEYLQFNDGDISRYYDSLDDRVKDFIEFIRQLSYCKISK